MKETEKHVSNIDLAKKYYEAAELVETYFPECESLHRYALLEAVKYMPENTRADSPQAEHILDLKQNIKELSIRIEELNQNSDYIAGITEAKSILARDTKLHSVLKYSTISILVSAILLIPVTYYNNIKSSVWRAEYFANPHLNSIPIKTTFEKIPNYSWDTSAPSPEIPSNNFSARWQSNINLEDETDITFEVMADDGVRVFVDSELIIDAWNTQYRYSQSIIKRLSKGTHTIKIEYFEAGGGAMIKTNIVGHSAKSKEPISLDFERP